MKHPLSSKNYIIQRENERGVRQWHLNQNQALSLMTVTLLVMLAFLILTADFLSNYFYERRLSEFRSNYRNVASNLTLLQDRLKHIDQQINEIEKKDKAVRTYAGMPEIDQDI